MIMLANGINMIAIIGTNYEESMLAVVDWRIYKRFYT